MPASPFSSDSVAARALGSIGSRWLRAARRCGACATVRPEDKEYLAEPAMTFDAGGDGAARTRSTSLDNREGSTGGGRRAWGRLRMQLKRARSGVGVVPRCGAPRWPRVLLALVSRARRAQPQVATRRDVRSTRRAARCT